MRIDRLELEGFRNYRLQRVDFAPDCNVIFGENAQGKTNLLEAVAYLSAARAKIAELCGVETDNPNQWFSDVIDKRYDKYLDTHSDQCL